MNKTCLYRLIPASVVLIAALVIGMSFAEPAAGSSSYGPDYVPGELLIKYKSARSTQSLASAHRLSGARVMGEFPRMRLQHVVLPQGVDMRHAIDHYSLSPDVEYVEPNYICYQDALPNDPRLSEQWGLTAIGAPAAWDLTTGSTEVVVAVLDSGVNYTHEDLAANMWRNPGEIAGNYVDDDLNGYVDDVYGIDTVNNDTNPLDDNGHGSHVAGIIGAVGNNSRGISGINWNTKIMALKFIGLNGSGPVDAAIRGLEYVTAMRNAGVNIRVINHSWGSTGWYSQALKDALDAAGSAGILNCCAAGNNSSDNEVNPHYPGSYDSSSIITVAASDRYDNPATFSNYGEYSVDLAAPGVSILSCYKGTTTAYANMQGTSMATPFVAGTAALLLSRSSSLSPETLKALLMNTADILPQWNGKTVTGGRLNLARAMQALDASPSQPDLMIKMASEGSFIGNDIYNVLETQTKSSQTVGGMQAEYHIRLVNDGGEPDTFIITGDPGDDNWYLQYILGIGSGYHVTDQITSESGLSVEVAGYSSVDIGVYPGPYHSTPNDTSKEITLHAVSQTYPDKMDSVKMITTKREVLWGVSPHISPLFESVVGKPVTITASPLGGMNLQYKFRVGYQSGTSTYWTTIKDYSSQATCIWTPTSAKNYLIEVFARETGWDLEVSGTANHNVVAALSSVALLTNPVSSTFVDTPVMMGARPTGGLNVEYKFKVGIPSGTSIIWSTVQDYGEARECTWTPTAPGTFTLAVYAREVGSTKDYDVTKSIPYQVYNPLTAVAISGSPGSPMSAAIPITLKASPTGGAKLSYQFRVGQLVNGVTTWKIIRAFGTTATYIWTPTLPGEYTVEVTAKETIGSNPPQFVATKSYVIGTALTSVTLAANPTATTLVTKPVILTAAATGGLNVQYQFKAGATVIRDFNSSGTCTWTPTTAGLFSVSVIARETGTTKVVTRVISYKVAPFLSAVKLVGNPVSPTAVGIGVLLTATPVGGLSREYEFRVGSVSTGVTWTTIRSYNSSPTCTWTPNAPGTYYVECRAREVGSTNAYDVYYIITYTVAAPVSAVSLAASLSSPRPAGTAITLSAAKTGGSNVQYKFRIGYLSGSSTVWATLKEYSSTSTFIWRPSIARTYTIEVWAREVGSTNAYDVNRTISYTIVPALLAVSISASPASGSTVNTPVTLTAIPTGGLSVEYQILVRKGTFPYTILKSYSSSNTCTWTPTSAGTYTLTLSGREAGTSIVKTKTVIFTVNP